MTENKEDGNNLQHVKDTRIRERLFRPLKVNLLDCVQKVEGIVYPSLRITTYIIQDNLFSRSTHNNSINFFKLIFSSQQRTHPETRYISNLKETLVGPGQLP